MRALIVLGLASVVGCASSPHPPSTGTTVTETKISTPRGSITINSVLDGAGPAQQIDAGIGRVWVAVAAAYKELGLPVSIADTTTHLIGIDGARVRRELAGERISRFFDCGTTAFGMRNADSYTIVIRSITSVVAIDGSHATVQTAVQATAANEGASEARVHCGSSGWLEQRIAQLAADRAK